MQGKFANVIVDISHENVDRPFAYRIPERLRGVPEPGMQVTIPFGRGNTLRTGYIIEVTDEADFEESRMKELDSIREGGTQVESRLIRLAFWMKEHYGSTIIAALKTVLPARKKFKTPEKKEIRLRVSREEARQELLECERKHQNAKARVLRELIAEECLPMGLLAKEAEHFRIHLQKPLGERHRLHRKRSLLPQPGEAGRGAGGGKALKLLPAADCG